jgi:hypothetical protein
MILENLSIPSRNAGTKQVAFKLLDNGELELNAVVSARRTGPIGRRTTIQVLKPGDVVFSLRWRHGEETYTISIVDKTGKHVQQQPSLWGEFRKHTDVNNWLAPSDAADYLPVPEEEWIATKTKRAKLRSFIRENKLPDAVLPWVLVNVSSKANLSYTPKVVQDFTLDLSQEVKWFLVSPTRTFLYDANRHGDQLPDTVIKAIRIETLEVGVKLDVYILGGEDVTDD